MSELTKIEFDNICNTIKDIIDNGGMVQYNDYKITDVILDNNNELALELDDFEEAYYEFIVREVKDLNDFKSELLAFKKFEF